MNVYWLVETNLLLRLSYTERKGGMYENIHDGSCGSYRNAFSVC